MGEQEHAGMRWTIDLGRKEVTSSPIAWGTRRRYLGGRGLGVSVAAGETDAGAEPLSPGNTLVFAPGLVTGTGIPLGARMDVVAKSPLTGTLASANSGGIFGAALHRAGVGALVIRGSSESPVLIRVSEDGAELLDASPYWGLGTGATTTAIQSDLGDRNARVACIGPAGERLCRIACIVNETSRVAGRGGLGAVMGAKRLKAIVVQGRRESSWWDPHAAGEVRAWVRERISASGITRGGLHRFGTASLMNLVNEKRLLPTRNFLESSFEGADRVSGEEMERTILRGRKGCYACPVACGRITEAGGVKGEGPEYETIWAFGPACGIDDLERIARANYLCNDLGLDTISTGATIACAMEMAERGYLDLPIRFGRADLLEELVRQIAFREGIGDQLAEGSFRFASMHGHPECSMSVKGQELPAYDPRGLQGQGLEFATSVRGACHVYGNMLYPEVLGVPVRLDPEVLEGKPFWTKYMQDLSAAIDALGICLFTVRVFRAVDYARMASEMLGMELGEKGLLEIGERIWNIQRLFNIGAGLGREDDTLPDRLLAHRSGGGWQRGWRRDPLLGEYYAERGWDSAGVPTRETRRRLGIP